MFNSGLIPLKTSERRYARVVGYVWMAWYM